MKLFLSFILNCWLCAGILACFEEQPLSSDLQKYLAQKKSCEDTLFPEPPCCGQSIDEESTNRIINGEQTGLREQTWTVYINITRNDFGFSGCGGSLINSLWVLSAAHCFEISINEEVHIGEWNINTDPDCINEFCAPNVVKIKSAKTISHPDYYENDWKNDLALLRLERPVVYSDFIKPICLAFNPLKKKCFENQKATTLGWGDIDVGWGVHIRKSPIKLKTTLSIWATDKCDNYKSEIVEKLDHEHNICASAGSNYTCHGDSGGPLTLKLPNTDNYYLVGVVSGGNEICDSTKHPALFNTIKLKWIVDVILKAEA